MKPLFDFLVKVDRLFEDDFKLDSGLVLHKDTRFDDFEGRISFGEIVGMPEKFATPAALGDILVFHHHINQDFEKYQVSEGVARVSYDPTNYQGQAYAAISPDGEIKMLGNWIFLRAVDDKMQENTSASGLFLGYQKVEAKSEAEVYCEGLGTEELGLKTGDLVRYSKNSDYRIKLPSGDEVFRCKPDDLLFKIEK